MRMKQYLTNTYYSLWQVILNGDGPIQDAKSSWAAIKSRFGGNVESKKMQKTILKQQFENFYVSDTKGLDKAYDRNKDSIDDLDIDDLYNNLKVFEADIKALGHNSQGQASSSLYTDDLMFSFFSYQSNSPQLDDEDLEQIDHDDLEEMDLKWQVAMLSMRVKRFYKKTRIKLIFNGKELIGFDKTKVECFNYHRTGHFAKECRAPRNQGNKNRDAGYRSRDNTRKTSYIAQDEQTEFALMAYTSNSSGSDTELVVHRKNEAVYEEKIAVLEFEVKDKSNVVTRLKNQLDETLREKDNLKGLDDSIYRPTANKTSASLVELSLKIRPVWNKTQRINHQNKFVPSIILTRSGRVPVSAAKQSSFRAAASTTVSAVKGNGVTAVKASAGCVWRPKMTDLNNVSKDNSGSWVSKRGNPQQALKNKGIFDSGCSRHMTGNKDFLTDYQDIDGGFVAFGGSDRDGQDTH
ncbi:putative ribonuclease H-like domain-containing protein [Tanacetum coccineum]